MDKFHHALAEICAAINYRQTFVVWDHTFSPKEFLAAQIENRFAKYRAFFCSRATALLKYRFYRQLVSLAFNKDTNEVAKPSELLSRTKTYMATVQTMEHYVQLGKCESCRRVST